MSNSKHRKNHKQKVAAFKDRMKQDKNKAKKIQRELLMNLIKQEQQKGLFDNNQTIPNTPMISGPIIDGPIIDGPIIDGPSI